MERPCADTHTGWYTHRQRSLVLAALPRLRFSRGFEPGCSAGELSAALARRCDRFVAADVLPQAVDVAARRLSTLAHSRVFCKAVPAWWPRGRFDLIVVNGFAQRLDDAAFDLLAQRIEDTLQPEGTLLLCQWRPQRSGARRSGDAVFHRFDRRLHLGRLGGWADDDMRIDLWCGEGQSVAAREGLR